MLMVSELHLKVANTRRSSDYDRVGRRYDVGKLDASIIAKKFAVELWNHFAALEVDADTVDSKWIEESENQINQRFIKKQDP